MRDPKSGEIHNTEIAELMDAGFYNFEAVECTCNFSDDTAAEIGHYPECPMVKTDLRYKNKNKNL